ncbi:MAG: CYTH domain-containing protein [Bacteroidales bacterium]
MGIEIERKFSVNIDKWNKVVKTQKFFVRQGYLMINHIISIRVRQTEANGYITIKGNKVGITRSEFEYSIPKEEAEKLIDMFASSTLSKFRYIIEFKNKLWEVDEFLEDNSGLIIAEIELCSETEQFELPEWIDKDVTHDEKYYNSNLSTHPFKKW